MRQGLQAGPRLLARTYVSALHPIPDLKPVTWINEAKWMKDLTANVEGKEEAFCRNWFSCKTFLYSSELVAAIAGP